MFSNPASGTLPGNAHQLSQHYTHANNCNTLPPNATSTSNQGGLSSTRRSPVSNSNNQLTAQNTQLNNTQGSLNTSQVAGGSSSNPSLTVAPSGASSSGHQTVVAYYFCNETIPYRTVVPFKNVTLAQFKALLTRRGRFR